MNDIIRLNSVAINNETRETVSARDLHSFLESSRQFSDWMKDRIAKYNFSLNQDFTIASQICDAKNEQLSNGRGGHNRVEYYLTLDMAKQLCMVENNDKGMQARKYFIDCENKLKSAANNPEHYIQKSKAEVLRLAADLEEQNEKLKLENEVMKPKAEFHDRVSSTDDCITVGGFAKVLGIGEKILFIWLREKGYLMSYGKNWNIPYQQFIDRGYFKVNETTFTDANGKVRLNRQPLVTGRGQIYIEKRLLKKTA